MERVHAKARAAGLDRGLQPAMQNRLPEGTPDVVPDELLSSDLI